MSREIKFRALCEHEDGETSFEYDNFGYCDGEATISDKSGFDSFVDINTLGQYTGLKDKNDKEVYEGDIVQAVWYSNESPECETFGEVLFNNSWLSFCIWDESNKTMSEMNAQGYYTWKIEVIGNIYKNPELLEASRADE